MLADDCAYLLLCLLRTGWTLGCMLQAVGLHALVSEFSISDHVMSHAYTDTIASTDL